MGGEWKDQGREVKGAGARGTLIGHPTLSYVQTEGPAKEKRRDSSTKEGREMNNIYIDPEIPLEQQIAFLRQSYFNFKFNVFQVLRDALGDEGTEIFKAIWNKTVSEGIRKIGDKSFAEIKKMAGSQDRIFGFRIERVDSGPDELQYVVSFCPYLEECKKRGMNLDICAIIEGIEMEQVSKSLGELTQPEQMCKGDTVCRIKLRNTLGR
jgi:hypothetical protein